MSAFLVPILDDTRIGGTTNPRKIATAGEGYQGDTETGLADPNLQQFGSDWIIYYSSTTQVTYGDGPSFRQHVRRMTSPNGKVWTRDTGTALAWSGTGWDSLRMETPSVVYDPGAASDRRYKMYYSGASGLHPQGFPNYKIGVAFSSDGITFTRHGSAPILDWPAFFPAGVDGTVADPEVFFAAGFYHLYCSCYARDSGGAVLGYGIAYAFSTDGISFTPIGIIFNGGQAASLLHNGSNFEMYFTRHITSPANELLEIPSTFNPTMGIWRNTSSDLISWTEELVRPFEWDSNNPNENLGLLTGIAVQWINNKRIYCYTAFSSYNVPAGFVVPTASGTTPAVIKLSLRTNDRP